jgi:hypothetical protein
VEQNRARYYRETPGVWKFRICRDPHRLQHELGLLATGQEVKTAEDDDYAISLNLR